MEDTKLPVLTFINKDSGEFTGNICQEIIFVLKISWASANN